MDNILLQKLAEQFGLALDWGSDNVIPYLEELAGRVVKYEVSQSIFWIVVGVLVVIIGIALCVLGCKSNCTSDERLAFWVCGIILIIVGIPIIGCQTNDLILCNYLPEKILLRYVNNK